MEGAKGDLTFFTQTLIFSHHFVMVGKVIEVFVTHTDSNRCGGVCLTCSWCALKNDILLVT